MSVEESTERLQHNRVMENTFKVSGGYHKSADDIFIECDVHVCIFKCVISAHKRIRGAEV